MDYILTSIFKPQWMLLLGIFLALFLKKNSNRDEFAKTYSKKILQWSVILLGASLNFKSVIQQGLNGAGITFVTIVLIFSIGYIGIKTLKIDRTLGILITMGTAICGGSAIAALAPIIMASSLSIAVSMGIVFLLNSLAIFFFPFIGEMFQLSQYQFGVFSALAIHDTSSVVAAASIYGPQALAVATTVKLTRALWIIPISLFYAISEKDKDTKGKISIPWFIVGFLFMSLLFTFINIPVEYKEIISKVSKFGFALTLFLIGLTFSLDKIKTVGFKSLLFGLILWLIVIIVSMAIVLRFI